MFIIGYICACNYSNSLPYLLFNLSSPVLNIDVLTLLCVFSLQKEMKLELHQLSEKAKAASDLIHTLKAKPLEVEVRGIRWLQLCFFLIKHFSLSREFLEMSCCELELVYVWVCVSVCVLLKFLLAALTFKVFIFVSQV